MSLKVTGLQPTSLLSTGEPGLDTVYNSISTATITGTGLKDGKDVIVLDPPSSHFPTYQWNGTTSGTNSDGTQCTVQLRQVIAPTGTQGYPPPKEDPTPVSVTVGSSPLNPNPSLPIGTPAVLLTGNYTVMCCATGGNYAWLAAKDTTTVDLANRHDTPQLWTFATAAGALPGCYTIQNVGNSQYLNWSSSGISLVNGLGGGTTWEITTLADGTMYIETTGLPPQYLNGNVENKHVDVRTTPDEHNGTSWSIVLVPARRA